MAWAIQFGDPVEEYKQYKICDHMWGSIQYSFSLSFVTNVEGAVGISYKTQATKVGMTFDSSPSGMQYLTNLLLRKS